MLSCTGTVNVASPLASRPAVDAYGRRSLIVDATLRTLLLSVPLVVAAGLARPDPQTEVVHAGVHRARFWAEKSAIRGAVGVALAGDSRVYHGLSPAEMKGLGEGPIVNLGFSGVCLCGPYLPFVTAALAPPTAGRRTVVLGVTPHSLTPHAAKDNGYLAEAGRSRTEAFERRYIVPALDFVEPITLEDIWRRATASSQKPTSRYIETFFADGWVSASLVPPKPDSALNEYSTVLASTKVDRANVDELVLTTRAWVGAGVRVVAFRPPVSPALRRLEDELAGYDEAAFRASFEAAGGHYLTFDDAAYETYDGSHLDETSARKLSRDLVGRLRAP